MTTGKIYSTGEIANRIKVEPVTVRKYAQMLEDKGYVFEKDEKGWRRFTEDDYRAFDYLRVLRNNGTSVEESIENIVRLYRQNLSVSPTDITIQDEQNPLFAFIKKQEEFNRELMQEVKRQREYIETRLEERDRKLMSALKESMETQKQLSASQKKKWWEFWK